MNAEIHVGDPGARKGRSAHPVGTGGEEVARKITRSNTTRRCPPRTGMCQRCCRSCLRCRLGAPWSPWIRPLRRCPRLRDRARPASSRSIKAILPPSSSWAFLRCPRGLSASGADLRRAGVGDHRDIGVRAHGGPDLGPPGTICIRSAGNPASSKAQAIITPPERGTRGSGLWITASAIAPGGDGAVTIWVPAEPATQLPRWIF